MLENAPEIVFSGESPLEICQKYNSGDISKPRLVRELVWFPYVKGGVTDGYDSLIVDPPGTWGEVSDAVRQGLISEEVYEDVFFYRNALRQGTLGPCEMVQEEPFDFAWCETHDETFPLGEVCPLYK